MGKIVKKILFLFIVQLLIGSEMPSNNNIDNPWTQFSNNGGTLGKLGQYGYPSNPMNDRAIGYLLKGKAKSAVTNYGEFIEWDVHPAGLWGSYTYLPDVCFVAGIPGQSYSYKYFWFHSETPGFEGLCPNYNGNDDDIKLWCSAEAYSDDNHAKPSFAWYEDLNSDGVIDTNFVSIVFDSYADVNAIVGEQKDSYLEIDDDNQWALDDVLEMVIISLKETGYNVNPNNSNVYGNPALKKTVGLVYPWALRPKLEARLDEYDKFDYGEDGEEWTEDDDYVYYGANTAESWFTRWNPSSNTDWQPSTGARINTHNTKVNAGDIFGSEVYVNESSTYPLLAHSGEQDTWPEIVTDDGTIAPTWPGGYAESFDPDSTKCIPPKRYNDDCWIETDRFISNQDVYMEFDDRWAHRGSAVYDGIYESTGYPMGLKVMATAHSYSVAFAEDVMFVTVDVRNESGSIPGSDYWYAFEKNRLGDKVYLTDRSGAPIKGKPMTMPDGTRLNGGKGFTYRDLAMGFYMDADVVSTDIYGNFGVHTNADDFMEYYDCANKNIVPEGCQVINDDTLRVSIAMIYDYGGSSGVAQDIGIVGTQLLDSPYATNPVDLDGDDLPDIYPGQKLKMTDWHWFDWYNRPGVVYREGDAGCCAGDPGSAQAPNKEEIQYKILAGDTTNLTDDERAWFFHTSNPSADNHEVDLDPHFDSLEGLELTEFFLDGEDGLDCVLEMSCGPFSLEVGEQVPFSFCIIYGENKTDIIENARFAQLMYNSHYQGYTEPDYPTVTASFDKGMVHLKWDNSAENTTDVVTGYSDFEGYKIYKSTDGGTTWGSATDIIYDDKGQAVGWRPYAQFHLTEEEDSNHCIYANKYDGSENADGTIVDCETEEYGGKRGINICGDDPHTPWFSLGDCDDSEELYLSKTSKSSCEKLKTGTWDIDGSFCYYDINHNNTYDEHIGIVNEFIDYDVIDGLDYTYSVTAYDMGIAPDYTVNYDPAFGIADTSFSTANPLHFATPGGYEYIETGKGTSDKDKNFITVKPGPVATDILQNDIKVVPNPYIVSSMFNETEYKKVLRFTNLPKKCKVTIYTISGEEVVSFSKPGDNNRADCGESDSGSCYWDLRSSNNQVIAPGLYIYTVEDKSKKNKGGKFIGKFAVVR